MKILLKVLALLFISQTVIADCGAGFVFYPQSPEVSTNTNIIIESYGYGDYLTLLKELDDKYPIYLKSEQRKIKLRKKMVVEGQYGLHQAIFQLRESLVAGEVYELEVQHLDDEYNRYFNKLKRRNKDGIYVKRTWIAKEKTDTESPKMIEKINFCKTELNHFGCGPAANAVFSFKTSDESEVFVLAEVMEVESQKSSTYFIKSYEKVFRVGHGMCSGAFQFKADKTYKIRFKLYDICGNTDDNWTRWEDCQNPWKNEEKRW